MTLLIGIRCKDGIVLGADGAATVVDTRQQPTMQMPVKKLAVFSNQVIFGLSGNPWVGQRVGDLIADSWRSKAFVGQTKSAAALTLQRLIWPVLEQELKTAKEAQQHVGDTALSDATSTLILVALPIEDRPCLLALDYKASCGELVEQLPFCICGCGQGIADPFLAFLRRLFWPVGFPSLAQATLTTVWTLQHAIKTHPGGVGGDMQLVTMRKDGRNWVAKEVDQQQLHEHLMDIRDAETVLTNFRSYLSTNTTPPPAPAK